MTIRTTHHFLSRTLAAAGLLVALLFVTGCSLGIETAVESPPVVQPDDSAPTAMAPTAVAPTAAPPTSAPAEEIVAPGPLPWPDATPVPGSLAIDATLPLGPISPYVYGTNFGPWVAVPFDQLDEAQAAGITILRFPGGEWGDRNDIQPSQIDRFIKLAADMGALPMFQTRLLNGTPEQAAELVRYVNIELGHHLPYWTIGNEPNLFKDYEVERFVTEWRAMAEAMLAADPTIQLLGPEINQFVGGPAPGPNETNLFLDRFLEVNGDLVDVVTVHRYPFGTRTNDRVGVEELMASSAEWDRLIPELRERIKRITGRDLPVGVTEINSYWTKDMWDETTPDSYNNAIWLADVLGRMIRQRVDIVTHFVLVSQDKQGGWGLLGNDAPRPSYYVYQLYQRFGQELLYAASGVDLVSIYAARREDGALTLLAINRGPDTVEMPIVLNGHGGGTAEVFRLDPERVAAGTVGTALGTTEIASGGTVSLPPYTATLYVLP